ncbi:MAG: hypothetical protein E7411_00505 [Ruminococcaceae bacterium]|nr:hypothetical protein [Oscillospiraceae bacterium]
MKKLLAFALSLSLILACMTGITLTASAATLDGEGTDASPFIIDSAEKFTAVFSDGTSADFTKVYLVTGFDQTEMTLSASYTPEKTQIFKGKLLGGNYVDGAVVPVKQKINIGTINNSAKPTHSSKNTYTGAIFHYVQGATISDLALYGTWNITTNQAWNHYFAVLVGLPDSKTNIKRVDNHVDINVSANGNYAYAGIAGNLSSSVVSDCDNYGDIKLTVTPASSRGYYIGGIVAQSYKDSTIENCVNYGDVVGNIFTGGITGYINTEKTNGNTIKNCINMGNISPIKSDSTARSIGAVIGGIADKQGSITVADCFNIGTITAATNTGLVCGLNNASTSLTISNFYDLANPSIASVIGSNGATLTVTNAYGYSETESTTANDVSKVSYETIAGLDEVFGSAWTKSGSYPYPMPASNIVAFGTADIPAPIFTLADLKNISNNPSSSYKLMADISGVDEMLCVETPFSGVFDGNGKTIELAIDESDYRGTTENRKYVGLFSQSTGTVKNLTTTGFVNVGYVNDKEGAGAVVGIGSTGSFLVENCKNYADITATGGHLVAGLVGRTTGGIINKCTNYGDISGYRTAGIVGLVHSWSAKINNCANYGNVTADYVAAGICSWTYVWNWMENNFNVGTIKALNSNGVACGLFGNVTNGDSHSHNITYAFNAGALIGNTTYGIAQINPNNTKTTLLRRSYNAVSADYPIANSDTVNPEEGKYPCYYLADSSQPADECISFLPVDKDGLKALNINSGKIKVVAGSAYTYPQIVANPIDEAYADIDFSLVTVADNTDDNTTVNIWACDDAKFYAVDGSEVTVKAVVSDEDFYEAYVNGEKAVDGKAYVKVNGDTAITLTTKEAEFVVPETLGNTMYAFNSDEKGAITLRGEEYTRYSLIFAKANKVTGLKRVEFGVYFGEDENISADNYKLKAVAESERISSEGAYGVLLYTEEGAGGFVNGRNYYVLPYSVYVDVDGTEYIVTGTTQTFSFNN